MGGRLTIRAEAWALVGFPGLIGAPVGIDQALVAGLLCVAKTGREANVGRCFVESAASANFGIGVAWLVTIVCKTAIDEVASSVDTERQRDAQNHQESPDGHFSQELGKLVEEGEPERRGKLRKKSWLVLVRCAGALGIGRV